MELFHVSCNEYGVGETKLANEETKYFQAKKDKGEEWVDLLLNAKKPDNAPSRQYTLYAFDFVGNCSAFFKSHKCDKGNKLYYKVQMTDPFKAPMCLTDLILKQGQSSSYLAKIIEEYWHPTMDWKFWEYLSTEMKIVEVLNEPNIFEKIKGEDNYHRDFQLRKQLIL